MQLINRFDVKLSTNMGDDKQVMVTVSFYRVYLDGAYKALVSALLDDGVFDDFVASVIRLLAGTGKMEWLQQKRSPW